MAFAFLAITPLHDLMVTISGTLALVSMFYITIFILKARLHFFAALSILCLLVFYSSNFVYYTRIDLQALPVLQKATIGISITWLLCLQYFTTAADFQPRKPVSVNTNEAVVNN